MSVAQSFNTFLAKIEITPEERERAQVLRQEVIARFGPSIPGVKGSFLGGSLTRGTAVRPLKDVDVFLELKEAQYPDRRAAGAQRLINDLIAAINRCYAGSPSPPSIRPQAHSVRIQPAGSAIALDVIPAFPRDPGEEGPRMQGYEIPETDPTEQWILTFPDAHATACKDANEKRAGGMLNALIKAVKHWNLAHEAGHSGHRPLRSFHLEVMCYRALDRKPDSIAGGLAILLRHLAGHVTDPCPPPAGKRPDVGEYLAKDESRRNWARSSLAKAAKLADEAIAHERAGNQAAACATWRNILGEPFPA